MKAFMISTSVLLCHLSLMVSLRDAIAGLAALLTARNRLQTLFFAFPLALPIRKPYSIDVIGMFMWMASLIPARGALTLVCAPRGNHLIPVIRLSESQGGLKKDLFACNELHCAPPFFCIISMALVGDVLVHWISFPGSGHFICGVPANYLAGT